MLESYKWMGLGWIGLEISECIDSKSSANKSIWKVFVRNKGIGDAGSTAERLKCSKAISGWIEWDGMGVEISVCIDSKSTALRCL